MRGVFRRLIDAFGGAGLGAVVAVCVAGSFGGAAWGQLLRDSVEQTEDVGLVRMEGAEPDLSLRFTDWRGEEVELGSMFDGETPVVLLLAYFDCPVICPLTLANLSKGVAGMSDMRAGEDYRVLVISFDHNDTAADARLQRERFVGPGFGQVPAEGGVEFWVAEADQVKPLAEAVGFYYKYMPEVDEFSHVSALVIMDGAGTVYNYYPGTRYVSGNLKRLLMQAGSGGERTIIEAAALFCFAWRPDENKWALNPYRVMQLGGGITLGLVATALIGLFAADRIRSARRAAGGGGG